MAELELWQYAVIIGTAFGVIGFGWNVLIFVRKQKGFMKLTLQSNTIINETENWIISKTSIENTSKKRMMINHAFLFIIDEEKTTREQVITCLNKQLKEFYSSEQSSKKTIQIMRPSLIYDLHLSKQLLDKNTHQLSGENFLLEWLPYYYKDNTGLGSFETLVSTHTYKTLGPGNYSVTFCVITDEFFKGKGDRNFRSAHDKAIIPK